MSSERRTESPCSHDFLFITFGQKHCSKLVNFCASFHRLGRSFNAVSRNSPYGNGSNVVVVRKLCYHIVVQVYNLDF